jgi:LAO/AO transport system kinase
MSRVDDLVKGIKDGNIVALAQTITLAESELEKDQLDAQSIIKQSAHSKNVIKIGISGTPGVGKSTFIESMGMHLIKQNKKIAVLAIDPSSEITGGSVLGDKTRMTQLSQQEEAFIRPSPSSGQLGGVARKTRDAIKLCEAFGFDVVILETVGVGQSEVQAASMVDLFVLLVQPGGGDDLQGIKRGIMELADVIVVNKADGNLELEAQKAKQHYSMAIQILRASEEHCPDVVTFSSLYPKNQNELWHKIEGRFNQMEKDGSLAKKRDEQRVSWLEETFFSTLTTHIKKSKSYQKALKELNSKSEDKVLQKLLKEFDL